MKTFIPILALLLAVSCKKDQPTPVIFEDFSFVAPASWKRFEGVGYDSKVGGITNGRDTLRYDIGMFSYRFTKETEATHYRTESLRNGYKALTVRPKVRGKGLIGLYIEVDAFRKLSIYGQSNDEAEVMEILGSVTIL
ncbi:hypothetical protein SAMN04487996_11124 [Dyadobacter soli]|uniref:Uncharacterized protein n=1 Tax=Dyadobacter soli TaxID=659014 RepID=A0A1G7LN40_9BACT|nr:hypothetical protein [Dyadobacter soli]SDF50389.1 hypothetical protein SAMN04487996_11124 [Dyadobacter soli]